jgi:hypothetical protein
MQIFTRHLERNAESVPSRSLKRPMNSDRDTYEAGQTETRMEKKCRPQQLAMGTLQMDLICGGSDNGGCEDGGAVTSREAGLPEPGTGPEPFKSRTTEGRQGQIRSLSDSRYQARLGMESSWHAVSQCLLCHCHARWGERSEKLLQRPSTVSVSRTDPPVMNHGLVELAWTCPPGCCIL